MCLIALWKKAQRGNREHFGELRRGPVNEVWCFEIIGNGKLNIFLFFNGFAEGFVGVGGRGIVDS